MLKTLAYAVTFPTTGRSFQNRIEFAPGLTAIVGRNEAGKTLNLEMIGYCLFGKSALRGVATDYKNLSATLEVEIKGHTVVLDRARKETMTVDGKIEAVGAEAINKAVPALLGFGLDVFNIACAAQQGDLDALSKMKPTERRQMIDRLIGIDLLEAIEKECRQEAKTHETVAQSLILSMAPPVEPERPEDYAPSTELEQQLAEAQAHERDRQLLLQIKEPVEPVAPAPPAEIDVATLEAHEAGRQEALRLQSSLEGQLRGMPEARHTREELAKAIAYGEYVEEVRRRGPRPDHSVEELRAWEMVWRLKSLATGHQVDCPKCDHHFLASDPSIDMAELDATPLPPLIMVQITTEFRRHELWATPLAEVEAYEISNIQQEVLAHAHAEDRIAVLDQLRDVAIPADRSGELRAARDYQQQLAVFAERRHRYDQDLATFRDARARLGKMADRSIEADELHGRVARARSFESQLIRYDTELNRYAELRVQFDQRQQLSAGFLAGGNSLKAARARVKQELAPSLSQAASTLLYAMTNGERRHIDVDEDFNILVDGQALQTLSGSGKSVVNLALRIGLGQVLTSKVLPIFLGDELDADMDATRAGATAETLQGLKKYLSQILIVTHKANIEADNTISLDMASL